MKTNLTLGSLFLVLILASAAVLPKVYYKSATFKVTSAVSNTVYPGVQGANISNNYTIKIKMLKSRDITFDSAWVDGNAVSCYALPTDGTTDLKFMKGDEFILNIQTIVNTNEVNPLPGGARPDVPKKENPPVKHSGKVLFRYKMFDNVYYFSVKRFTVGQNVYAP